MTKRRFKKTYFKGRCNYEPTIKVKDSVLVSDKFHKKHRIRFYGNLDSGFSIKSKKGKC